MLRVRVRDFSLGLDFSLLSGWTGTISLPINYFHGKGEKIPSNSHAHTSLELGLLLRYS